VPAAYSLIYSSTRQAFMIVFALRLSIIISSKMEGSSWLKVSNSPLNTSKTKMLFSFSRTKRFGSVDSRSSNNNSYLAYLCRCDRYYDLPPLIGKNAPKAAIGYGRKQDLVLKGVADFPPPNKYSIKSIFDECKKGYGFRLGRDVQILLL